jgi:hypothetical protein
MIIHTQASTETLATSAAEFASAAVTAAALECSRARTVSAARAAFAEWWEAVRHEWAWLGPDVQVMHDVARAAWNGVVRGRESAILSRGAKPRFARQTRTEAK